MREGWETGPLSALVDKSQAHRLNKLYSLDWRRKQSCFLIDGMHRYRVAAGIANQNKGIRRGDAEVPWFLFHHTVTKQGKRASTLIKSIHGNAVVPTVGAVQKALVG